MYILLRLLCTTCQCTQALNCLGYIIITNHYCGVILHTSNQYVARNIGALKVAQLHTHFENHLQ